MVVGLRPLTLSLLLSAAALAGCSGDTSGNDPTLRDAEEAAQDLNVQATSNTGVIRGIVVDESIKPIAGVAVRVLPADRETATNEEGAFGFDNLEPGTYFLTTTKDGYSTIQQSVDVIAGQSDPPIVRVQVQTIPKATPFIEAFQVRLYFSGAVSTPVLLVRAGDLVGDEGTFFFELDITPNGTLAQAEFQWEPTTALGSNLFIGGGTYIGDDDLDVNSASGPSVLVLRANATEDGDTADKVAYNMWSGDFEDPPAAYVQQSVDAFVHVFHNFLPREGWTFTADGEHPLPP